MSKNSVKLLKADVLVIGGGSAASRAALESEKQGAETLLVTKGKYGFSGTSNFHVAESAGFSASGFSDTKDSVLQHQKDILDAALGPCNDNLAATVACKAPKQVTFLENLGVKFERYRDNYLATKGCFASRKRSLKIKGHGEPIVDVLKREIIKRGNVNIIEDSMVTDLIVENNICKGAFIASTNGQEWEIRSKSTILATGGAGQLFSFSLNPLDITGDGYALGYRAGAELVNMEFMQSGFGIIEPAKTIFNAWIWSLNPKIYDEDGIEFLKQYIPVGISIKNCMKAKMNHYPFSTRDISKYLEIAVKKHCNKGKRVYSDLRHVLKEAHIGQRNDNLTKMWPITKAWMKRLGIDVETTPVRLVIYAHAMNGGLLIDINGQTTVSNLYAVGEVASGYHGADRLGGNMFASGQVFGEIAGKHAAKNAFRQTDDIYNNSVREKITIANKFTNNAQNISIIRKKLQKLSTDNLLIVRDGQGLKLYLAKLNKLEEELNQCIPKTIEQLYLRETKNLLVTGYLIAQGALKRKESRGSHYREDFSDMGDNKWRKAIIQKLESGIPVIKFRAL